MDFLAVYRRGKTSSLIGCRFRLVSSTDLALLFTWGRRIVIYLCLQFVLKSNFVVLGLNLCILIASYYHILLQSTLKVTFKFYSTHLKFFRFKLLNKNIIYSISMHLHLDIVTFVFISPGLVYHQCYESQQFHVGINSRLTKTISCKQLFMPIKNCKSGARVYFS